MRKKHDLTSAIIAGGLSTRFGEPKAQAVFTGRTLLQHAIILGYQVSNKLIIIDGKNQQENRPEIPVYCDIIPGCGPLGGIYTALHHAQTPYIATIPCDMPRLIPEIYEVLYEHRQKNIPVVAVSNQGIEPIISIWPKKSLAVIQDQLLNHKLSLRKSLAKLRAKYINISEYIDSYHPEIFLNINYKEDLDELSLLSIEQNHLI